jgi:zinc protease
LRRSPTHRDAAAVALALVALAAARSAAVAREADMAKIFPYPAHVDTLDNGLRVIVVPFSSGGIVAYWTIVRTGSRDEIEPGRTGFAHFFEHMMFQGTERFPQDEYNRAVTRMGADANAYTTDDLTAYHLSFAAADLERVVDLESDRFRNLSYSEQDFKTEAGAVLGEYRKSRTNPWFQLHESVAARAFESHTYGHTTMGYEQDIRRMPELYEYSRSFFSRYYRPDNAVLLIVGEVEVGPVLKLVRRHYDAWQPGYEAPAVPIEPAQTAERRVEVEYEGQSLPILWISYKADRFDPADARWVSGFLLAELAFGETSPIHEELVLRRQLVDSIGADQEMNRDPGTFSITTRVKDPARVDEVLAAIDVEIERHRTTPPEAARLADLRSRLKYGFLMSLDTPDRVASALARVIGITGGIEAIDRLYATADRITPQDVQAAARRYLDPDRRTVGVLRARE